MEGSLSKQFALFTNTMIEVVEGYPNSKARGIDVYFSADVETDGSIPGPYSMLSFAFVYAGAFDGQRFYRPPTHDRNFYAELRPISDEFQPDALHVNGLNRDKLLLEGEDPSQAMTRAASWVSDQAKAGSPVLVAYPLSFDWTWLYWYFERFSSIGSPFGHSRGFDLKTAIAVKLGKTVSSSGRSRIPDVLKSLHQHTHHALDDAIEQADIFANLFTAEYRRDRQVLPTIAG